MSKKIVPPVINQISNLRLPKPNVSCLRNGIRVYDTRLGTEAVIKLEIVFHTGRALEHKKLITRASSILLKEGTQHFTSAEIAENIDYYGATLNSKASFDHSFIRLYIPKKHFIKVLPIIREMIVAPLLPEEELIRFKERSKQKLQIDLSKNDIIAYRDITEKIYGEKHFYGYNSNTKLFDDLSIEDVRYHLKHLFGANNCRIFISGKTDEGIIQVLDDFLGEGLGTSDLPQILVPECPKKGEKIRLNHNPGVQTAIKIGSHTFNRSHEDYPGMFVLNTILGGYFGSRLMSSIREEKGFTYNIYSSLDALQYDGCFYIATEVGNEYVEDTIKAIYHEMNRLQAHPVSKAEIQMTRQYLLGNMLTMLDGPFNVSEVIRTLISEEVPLSHFNNIVETVQSITPIDLQNLAQEYFNSDHMWEVVVG